MAYVLEEKVLEICTGWSVCQPIVSPFLSHCELDGEAISIFVNVVNVPDIDIHRNVEGGPGGRGRSELHVRSFRLREQIFC